MVRKLINNLPKGPQDSQPGTPGSKCFNNMAEKLREAMLVFGGTALGASLRFIISYLFGLFWNIHEFDLPIFVGNCLACLLMPILTNKYSAKINKYSKVDITSWVCEGPRF